MDNTGALLLGRRTYEDFYAFWPKQTGNPFTAMLDNMQKYVASTTLSEPLSWSNSTLLPGDAAEAVGALKEEPGKDLLVMGSGELIQSRRQHNLVDEYILLIHPLVLGSGRRLFADGGAFAALRLVATSTTTSGVVIATYQPAIPEAPKTITSPTHSDSLLTPAYTANNDTIPRSKTSSGFFPLTLSRILPPCYPVKQVGITPG